MIKKKLGRPPNKERKERIYIWWSKLAAKWLRENKGVVEDIAKRKHANWHDYD